MEKYNRYNFLNTIRSNKGNRVYQTCILPKIEKADDDIYIYARKGDRLDILSFEYYGDVVYWPVIAQANNIGKGTLYIDNDVQLRIPASVDKFIGLFEEANKESL